MNLVSDSVYLISVGTELLKGEVLNSNAAFLGRTLNENGLFLAGERTVPDNAKQVHLAIKDAFSVCDTVITTGGLGPTFDDITRETVARYFARPLIFSSSFYTSLIRRMSNFRILSNNLKNAYRRQSYFPRNSSIIRNNLGSAAGFMIRSDGKTLISLPGVPLEFENMILREVLRRQKRTSKARYAKEQFTVKAIGITETEFLKKLGKLPITKDIQYGIYPDLGEIRFTMSVIKSSPKVKREMSRVKKAIRIKLRDYIYSFKPYLSFEEVLAQQLRSKRKTVSIAESCTGGYVSKLLTHVSGSSNYFKGGMIAYSNEIKKLLVGVPASDLTRFGAVSSQVARLLCSNIRKIMKTNYGIGITGIAGPGGGTRKKPVGLVYIGISDQKSTHVYKYYFKGNREKIRTLASKWAIFLLWQKIRSEHS